MPQREIIDTARPSFLSLALPWAWRTGAVGPLAAVLLMVLVVLGPSRDARGQCFPDTLRATIPNPAPWFDDSFGWSVAVSGNVVVVGAHLDDTGATNAGTAYVHEATTGALVTTLSNPAPAADDHFGRSVAVSGNMAVVGVSGDDAGATNAGTAYVFDVTSGALVTTLSNPAPAADDRFGWSVALSGNVAVIGAYLDNAGATDAGTAYVFDATTGSLVAALNKPAPAADDYFGYSVAVSGNVAVVGAIYADAADAGTAYVFDATTGALVTTLSNPTPAFLDFFGHSVAVSGNVAVVGAYEDDTEATNAGMAYVFDAMTGTLVRTLSNPAPSDGDFFGVSVAVSGNVVVVGSDLDDAGAADAGTAYVFDATTGSLETTLSHPTATGPVRFGFSVSVSGNVAVVGAWADDPGAAGDAGSAYTFSCTPPPPTPSPSPSASPPSVSPSASPSPTTIPTASPTQSPSSSPTSSPTAGPSPSPSATPTPPGTPNTARDWTLYE